MEKAAKLGGVVLHHLGKNLGKIIQTLRTLKILEKLLKCKSYKKAAKLILSCSALLTLLVGIAAEVIVEQLRDNDLIGPFVAAKVTLLISVFGCGIYIGFALYTSFSAKEMYSMKKAYDEAKIRVNDAGVEEQLRKIADGIEELKTIEAEIKDIFAEFDVLERSKKDPQVLLHRIREGANKANDAYESTYKAICKLYFYTKFFVFY